MCAALRTTEHPDYQSLLYLFNSSLSSFVHIYYNKQAHNLHLVHKHTQNCSHFSPVQMHLSEKTHRCTRCNVICLNGLYCFNETQCFSAIEYNTCTHLLHSLFLTFDRLQRRIFIWIPMPMLMRYVIFSLCFARSFDCSFVWLCLSFLTFVEICMYCGVAVDVIVHASRWHTRCIDRIDNKINSNPIYSRIESIECCPVSFDMNSFAVKCTLENLHFQLK